MERENKNYAKKSLNVLLLRRLLQKNKEVKQRKLYTWTYKSPKHIQQTQVSIFGLIIFVVSWLYWVFRVLQQPCDPTGVDQALAAPTCSPFSARAILTPSQLPPHCFDGSLPKNP